MDRPSGMPPRTGMSSVLNSSGVTYSSRKRRRLAQFIGPGEKRPYRSKPGEPVTALWAWRKFKDDCIDERDGQPQQGINCAIFRNESGVLSSDLIRQADAIADFCWPDRRHYTYVDPKEVRSANPGACFIHAGWKRCGVTKGGLVILERVLPLHDTQEKN